jgi:hypothetical protein
MPKIELSQAEADRLIGLEKHYLHSEPVSFPNLGEKVCLELESNDRKEFFLLDITYQNRAGTTVILLRLDLVGPKHRNPDGEEVVCPHIHRYKEGYGDKWAYEIGTDEFKEVFTNPQDLFITIEEFMDYCNIITKPVIQLSIT